MLTWWEVGWGAGVKLLKSALKREIDDLSAISLHMNLIKLK